MRSIDFTGAPSPVDDAQHRLYGVTLRVTAAGDRGAAADRRPRKRPKPLPLPLACVLHHLARWIAPANASPALARQP